MNLILLLGLHHIADVAFQPSWLIKMKHEHLFSIYEHVFVWATVVSMGLMYLGMFSLWKFFFLLVGHFVIDWYKYQKTNGDYRWIYPDQALHYLQVIAVFYL